MNNNITRGVYRIIDTIVRRREDEENCSLSANGTICFSRVVRRAVRHNIIICCTAIAVTVAYAYI